MKKTTIDMVREFHEKFEHVIETVPTIPPEATNKFRAEFMEEEARETMLACAEGNLIELADGLGDMQYVLDGWFLNAGLADKKDEIVAEIHRSNLTKLCKDEQQAVDSKAKINYTCPLGDEVDYRAKDDYFVIFRVRDGKIGKSIYYEKPRLFDIVHDVLETENVDEDFNNLKVKDSIITESVTPGPYGSLHLGRGNFGSAIQALEDGKMICRSGWNGKRMYLILIKGGHYGLNSGYEKLWQDLREGAKDTDLVPLLPWIGMKTADNKFVPWLASQTDVLAKDWEICE